MFILGPCVLESKDQAIEIASHLKKIEQKIQKKIVFKGSFDKANRSSLHSKRGLGIKESLKIFDEIKSKFGFECLTDVHESHQVREVAEVLDFLQIPAFLCRQTDLLLETAKAAKLFGRKINVKKGQFLSPEETGSIVQKIRSVENFSPEHLFLTERGTSFGYQALVVDMMSFRIMKKNNVTTVFDVTHSVQKPGAGNGVTLGLRSQMESLARAAAAAGSDWFFMETHPDPKNAFSDAATQLPLNVVEGLCQTLISIQNETKKNPWIETHLLENA